LRALLVDDLLNNSAKYKINLDRNSRKQLRLMRHAGQLPSLDVLMAVSRIFEVRVFVYFWNDQPIIYQFSNYSSIIHLQCISGIHFNPLIKVNGYNPPDTNACTINTVPDKQETCSQHLPERVHSAVDEFGHA
jgi:hypothetical protein